MSSPAPGRGSALVALLLASAWIAAGALFKLFMGSPNDLPPVLRQVPIPLGTLFPAAIGIELAVVASALLRPALGWRLVTLQYLAFLGVLGWLLSAGAESCGCFGSQVKIPPAVMLGIDGGLLALLLSRRPWRSLAEAGQRRGAPLALLAPTLGACLALPFLMSREVKLAPREGNLRLSGAEQGALVPAPQTSAQVPGGEAAAGAAAPTADTASAANPEPPAAPASQGFVILEPEQWVGKSIFETGLDRWLPLEELPGDGLWVFWRVTCDHCRDHLLQLMNTEQGQRPLVLVRLREAKDRTSTPVVEILPQGGHVTQVELPEGFDWVVTTPAELELSGYTVVRGAQGVKPH
jgi:hypothetical protein